MDLATATITTVDLVSLATSFPYAVSVAGTTNTTTNLTFQAFSPAFDSILGSTGSAKYSLISNQSYNAFHEAGIYSKATNSVYISSNYLSLSNPINITVLNLGDGSISSNRYPGLYSANGACPYTVPTFTNSSNTTATVDFSDPDAGKYILWADEGDFQHPSALTLLDPVAGTATPILTSFIGRNFSSLNDVKQDPITGDIWFTDAEYGYFQAFRNKPSIPPQVYRFEPLTGVVQTVADGFVEPNGIELSPDGTTVYVTDSGQALKIDPATGEQQKVLANPATIYAFDILPGRKQLGPRRMFAYSDEGIPDGIHCDAEGNVWAGCGDGIHIWDPMGRLIGKIVTPQSSVNNFGFIDVEGYGRGVIMENAEALWWIETSVKGRVGTS